MWHTVGADEAGLSVSEVLVQRMGISRRMIQRLTRSRGIKLNDRPAFLRRPTRLGDVVAARVETAERSILDPIEIPLSIVCEDADLLVVDKPAGILVHPTDPSHDRTLAHGVAYYFEKRGIQAVVRPVHRLDYDTSGLLLFAKTAFAHHRLDQQLRSGQISRGYWAVVEGSMEADSGIIDVPIGRSGDGGIKRSVTSAGKEARTHFTLIERLSGAALLELALATGRTHQIRIHLAHIGHPVIGDVTYGAQSRPGFRRVALHASSLTFLQPTSGEQLELECPLPAELVQLLDSLRG